MNCDLLISAVRQQSCLRDGLISRKDFWATNLELIRWRLSHGWQVRNKNDFNLCCLLSPHYIEWFILCLNTVLMAKPINFVFNCSKIFIIALFFNTTKHHDALVHYSVTRPCCLDKLESWKLGSGRWDLDGWSCLGTTLNLVIEYSNVELIIKWT